jgi:lipoprotein NlpI
MKLLKRRITLLVSLYILSFAAFGQTDSAGKYVSIRGIGVKIVPPPDFHWTQRVNGSNYGGFVRDDGARILVMQFPAPVPHSQTAFDSDFVQHAGTAQVLSRRDVTVDGFAGFEHVFHINKVFIDAVIFGDTASSIMFEGICAASDGDSTLAAMRASFATTKWNPHEQLTASDLDYSVITKPPFTRVKVDQQYITYMPEDTAGHEGVPSFVVAHIPASAGEDDAKRKAFASGLITGNKLYSVEKIDSISGTSIDSLPALRLRTAATMKADGRKLQIYMCVVFEAAETYVIEGVSGEADARTNIPIFEQIAKTFQRREEYSSIINDAIDYYKKRMFKASYERAKRATILYPDSGWGYYAKALDENDLGLYSEGLEDINKSVMLDHNLTGIAGLRAQFEEQTGDTKAAAKDYALTTSGEATEDFFGAARFHIAMGHYAVALKELRAYNEIASEPYAHIWEYFAEWKATEKDSAAAHLRAFRDNSPLEDKFCGEIIRYLLGELPENELIEHSQFGINQSDVENFCEANFYAGMNELLLGAPEKTKAYWKTTIDTGVTEFIEYMYARAHMPR